MKLCPLTLSPRVASERRRERLNGLPKQNTERAQGAALERKLLRGGSSNPNRLEDQQIPDSRLRHFLSSEGPEGEGSAVSTSAVQFHL